LFTFVSSFQNIINLFGSLQEPMNKQQIDKKQQQQKPNQLKSIDQRN
jgi:hypothetical protein